MSKWVLVLVGIVIGIGCSVLGVAIWFNVVF